ncbi:hypothetical protein AVEN_72754-1 [Araneus ventricosus]|uniref:Uncharacterized protein n=1 Tax=Araneus ventricosus TaxID=182803 RepID=A0A4Y2DRH8_ARAVE|nr:hypothetical protein AVEN_72754-1 [Araneus ventricosus]
MSEKLRPSRTPLRRGNKEKSAGARSGEYGRCSRTVTLRVARKCLTRIALCGRALSWNSFQCPLWPNSPLQQPFQNSLLVFRVDG